MTIQEIQARFAEEFTITLNDKEAQQFTTFQPYLLLGACKSTQRWIAKKAQGVPPITINRSATLSSVLRTCQYRVANAKPKSYVKPFAEKVKDLREFFQTTIGDKCSVPFCITEEETGALLKRYSDEVLKAEILELARWFCEQQPEPEHQHIVDQFTWMLSEKENFVVPLVSQ